MTEAERFAIWCTERREEAHWHPYAGTFDERPQMPIRESGVGAPQDDESAVLEIARVDALVLRDLVQDEAEIHVGLHG